MRKKGKKKTCVRVTISPDQAQLALRRLRGGQCRGTKESNGIRHNIAHDIAYRRAECKQSPETARKVHLMAADPAPDSGETAESQAGSPRKPSAARRVRESSR